MSLKQPSKRPRMSLIINSEGLKIRDKKRNFYSREGSRIFGFDGTKGYVKDFFFDKEA